MKLLLTSNGLSTEKIKKEFLRLVGKPVGEIKILFMTTASGAHKVPTPWLDRDKEILFNLGISKNNLVEFNFDKKIKIEEFDVLFIEGGNTYYLLKRIREEGFDKEILLFVKKNRLYLGVSAGSVLAGPDISISHGDDNLGLTDFTGLKLIDKVICPHFQKKDPIIIENFEKKTKCKTLPLNDGQALLIEGKMEEII